LSRGSFILELDAKTDVLAAKEILTGHARFHGDAQAALPSTGPQDAGGYCGTLMERVGDDGGPVLGSGRRAPRDVKPDNFREVLQGGRNARGCTDCVHGGEATPSATEDRGSCIRAERPQRTKAATNPCQ